ncbi:hypothetical protein ACLQ25_17460 [Micromonospora sp. DT44]
MTRPQVELSFIVSAQNTRPDSSYFLAVPLLNPLACAPRPNGTHQH